MGPLDGITRPVGFAELQAHRFSQEQSSILLLCPGWQHGWCQGAGARIAPFALCLSVSPSQHDAMDGGKDSARAASLRVMRKIPRLYLAGINECSRILKGKSPGATENRYVVLVRTPRTRQDSSCSWINCRISWRAFCRRLSISWVEQLAARSQMNLGGCPWRILRS